MNMETIIQTISNHFVLVVMVACLVAGYILKHATIFNKINNNDIPIILAVIGAIINTLVGGLNVESVVYGAAMGLASTGFHQAFKNYVEKRDLKESAGDGNNN